MGKNTKDGLDDRQKAYEKACELKLIPKIPVIVRVDGKAFHTFTRGMKKPFDDIIGNTMKRTLDALCKDIQTCVFGYTQSDEITLILNLPDRINSQPYLGGKRFKIESLTASKATRYFNKFFREEVEQIRNKKFIEYREEALENKSLMKDVDSQYIADRVAEQYANEKLIRVDNIETYLKKLDCAEFDARAFNIPEWDCINNIIWRQQDAIRNSVEAAGRANLGHAKLHKINVEGVKQLLLDEAGIDWEKDFSTYQKRGVCCYMRKKVKTDKHGIESYRYRWVLDEDMPIIQNERNWFSQVTGLIE